MMEYAGICLDGCFAMGGLPETFGKQFYKESDAGRH